MQYISAAPYAPGPPQPAVRQASPQYVHGPQVTQQPVRAAPVQRQNVPVYRVTREQYPVVASNSGCRVTMKMISRYNNEIDDMAFASVLVENPEYVIDTLVDKLLPKFVQNPQVTFEVEKPFAPDVVRE